ncbi:hypothetical protein AEA09_09885 [Lysinibacillus contaminans]|uniref:Uncharacterized protein n=1 Tax=Lysinibacillus contaminans TaxID=1293441 RepID=A0ABR5K1P3_9BACI|nr:hypothetical protein [Lysinibacillus contaminans]KOS68818.1 hypothetical protein AEA09_09885 [Lysinibacillus contaminans]
MVLISEIKFGSKAQSINEIAERLSAIDWYKKAGVKEKTAEEALQRFMQKLQVVDYEIQWITKEQTSETISKLTFDNSELWKVLSSLPDLLKKKIDEAGLTDLLKIAVETVPQAVFHAAFQKAFQEFGEEKQVNFFVGHAMYIAVLVCTAELAGEADSFTPLLELLEAGHVPVGLDGNTIYLL